MTTKKTPMTEERKAELSLAALRLIGRSGDAIDKLEMEEALVLIGATEDEFIEWATDIIGEDGLEKFLGEIQDESEEASQDIAGKIFCPACEIGLLKAMEHGKIVCRNCFKTFG